MSGIQRIMTGADVAKMDAMLFSALCQQHGLPAPKLEHRFAPHRNWAFDFAWPDAKVALESEGAVWKRGRHTRGKGFIADMEKYSEAALRGWCVLRVNRTELMQDGLTLVRRALGQLPVELPPPPKKPRKTAPRKPPARPRCEIEIRPL